MSAPYDPRVCCVRCWSIEHDRRAGEATEDAPWDGRVEVPAIPAQAPVWINHQGGYIYCRDHIPDYFLRVERFFALAAPVTSTSPAWFHVCETCGAPPERIPDALSGLDTFEDMLRTPSGRIFCSVAHIPDSERIESPWVHRVGPCETCGREIHTTDTVWKDGKPPRLFCSSRCHIRFYDLRKQARRARDKRRPCVVCGKIFEPRQSNAITCSSACRQKAYRQRRVAS